MRRLLIVILTLLAIPTMIHLTKMDVIHGLARTHAAHAAGMPFMPECPVGYVCPAVADSAPRLGIDAAAFAAIVQVLAFMAAIPLLLAFASASGYRPPFAVPIPSDPKVALSTFKRE